MRMTGSKKYRPVGTKAQPVWGSIFDQRKSQLHHFTIGFQKPGICADSWFLESNGKMVQLAQIPGFWNPMVKWCNWDFL
jgi:hypothetical protein